MTERKRIPDYAISTEQLCKRWGITMRTMRSWIKTNNANLPKFFYVGSPRRRRYRFLMSEVIKKERANRMN